MEDEFLAWLHQRLPPDPRIAVAPGDDAAVLSPTGPAASVLCVDTIVEGVDFHFCRDELPLVGRKALAINLSDLAAMCSFPVAALVSLTIPPSLTITDCQQIYEGLLELAAEYDVAIAGGDFTVAEGPLSLSVTLAGTPSPTGNWLRRGAKAGDAILVTGTLGGSILGHHMTFSPRLHEARRISEEWEVHAATDISDGLLRDLSNIARASGLAAHLELEAIPISPAASQLSRDSGLPPLQHALSDGEDFELLLAVPGDQASRMVSAQPLDCQLTCIGTFHAGHAVHTIDAEGTILEVEPSGYQHGAPR
jgi:thiamine-monophosphate kinase